MSRTQRSTTQIAFLVVGTLLVVLCIFFMMLLRRTPVVSLAERHALWQRTVTQEVGALLEGAPTAEQIATAKDRVLALTVAPDDRETHLALVMALLAWQRGEQGARASVQRAVDLIR